MPPHRHTLGIRFTGPDIQLSNGTHYHSVGDKRTSSDNPGPRHVHTLDNRKTSGPVPLESTDAKKDLTPAAKKKKKKRRRGKKSVYNQNIKD